MKECKTCKESRSLRFFSTNRLSCEDCLQILKWELEAFKKECADNLAWSKLMFNWRV